MLRLAPTMSALRLSSRKSQTREKNTKKKMPYIIDISEVPHVQKKVYAAQIGATLSADGQVQRFPGGGTE